MLPCIFLKYFGLLIIQNFLIFKITCNNCICSDKNNENDCKLCDNCKFFYVDETCIECTINLSPEFPYYKKKEESPFYELISLENISEYKLIYGTKEVVSESCPTGKSYNFTFYNICHKSIPYNSIVILDNNYQCPKAYYKESIDGFDYYTCYSTDNCPSTFKYYTSSPKQCLNSCDKTIKKEQNGDSFIYRCEDNCIRNDTYNEFEFEEISSAGNTRYCLDKCPSEYKYYYIEESIAGETKLYKCLEKCNNNHLSKDNICVGDNCNEGDKIIIDINQKTFSCTQDCPQNFPYNYNYNTKNYCLKSCNDTNNDALFDVKEKTYLLEQSDEGVVIRKCEKDNPEEGIYFKDDAILKWVTDCKISQSGPFHVSDSCKSSCEGYDCSTNDDFMCMNISDGTEYFLEESEHICYKTCPNYSGKGFHDKTNHKCTSCSEGYYRFGDKNCYSSCNDINTDQTNSIQFYINYGEKLCFEGGCTNNPLYKYIQYQEPENDSPKICYQSCFNISGARFEKDNICYENDLNFEETSDYYYYTIQYEGIELKKYTKNPNDCIQAGFPYLVENTKQCQSNCNYYKIIPTEKIIGKCCETLNYCINETFKFYNETDKIITDKCKEFTVVDINGEVLTENGNCINVCPNDYCEDSINKLCYKECKHYSIENEKKIFKNECNKYFFKERDTNDENDVYKCVDICEKLENNNLKYIYYLDSGECRDSCPLEGTSTNSFSYETNTSHQPCLDNCKNEEYYYELEQNAPYPIICREKCDKYYKGTNSQICVENCENNEYILPGNICSTSSCPSNTPFFYTIIIQDDPSHKVKKCVSNCKNNEYYNYNYSLDTYSQNECIENCPGYIYNGGCYSICPEGLYVQKEEEDNKKKCVTNCQNKFYYNSDSNSYECLDICNDNYPFLTSSGECVKKCPINEIFIGSDNKCLTSCENDVNKYYEEKELSEDNDNSYKNYICLSKCSDSTNNKIYMYGTKECISSCNDYLYVNGDEKICYKICISNIERPFSTNVSNSEYGICAEECKIEGIKNFLSDKICKSGCNTLPNNIINDFDNSCVNKCNLTINYKYLQKKSSEDNSLHCKNSCDPSLSTKRYLSSNYICIEKCTPPNNYVVEDNDFEKVNECLSECPENKPYMRENDNGEYICSSIPCGNEDENEENKYSYYYMDTNICLKKCDNLYFYELNSKKYCAISCDFFKDKKLYYLEDEYDENYKKQCVLNCTATSKQFTKMNGHCDTSCDDYEFHNESEYICMSKCPYGTINLEEKKCKKCENLEPSQYIDENGNCIEDCEKSNTGFIYHNKDEFVCKDNCENKYIEDNVCKDECETKLFMNGKICLEVCPSNKRFFIDNETYSNKTCLNDCPIDFQFYSIDSTKNFYKCTNNCNAYILNYDPKMNAKICLGATCNETYPYYINDNDTKKICYNECPKLTPYFIKEEGNIKHCYKECPIEYVHLIDEFECIEYIECKESKSIKYYEKLCIDQCSKIDKIFIKGDLAFCFDNCSIIPDNIKPSGANLKLTYDNQCIETCPGFSEEDDNHNNCICKRLFYYDKTTGFKTCLNRDLTLCESIKDYPILKNDTNECTNYCDGILSLSGYECYNNSYQCRENETLTTLTNGDQKCECIDKFYNIIQNERNVTKCLKIDDTCPSSFSLLVKDTNECVNECPTGYKLYGKTCVSACPYNTIENSERTKCECEGKWYISDSYDVICAIECPSEKNLYIENTKQCVSSCIGTGFEVYYNKTCIHNCSNIGNVEQILSKYDPYLKDISKECCRCKNIWYYDLKGYDICTDNIKSCDEIEGYNFKYIISSSKQCDNKCPENYFRFNNECLLDCRSEHIKDESSKMCKCKNLWKYENGTTICLDLTSCPDDSLLIKRTNECYFGNECPIEDPLIYDKMCYEKYNCPKDLNTRYDEIKNQCICVNKWYKVNGKINCLTNSSDCPFDYPYLNSLTKECQTKQQEITEADLYEYNYIFYKNCPEKTIKDENLKKCICDPLLGFWYTKQDSFGKEILVCGEEKCPDIKKYNIYQQKECIPNCPDDYQYLYQGICYEKCPDLTEIIGNTKECQLKLVDNEINLENLEKAMTENIVDLYKKSNSFTLKNNTSVGQKIVTKNATVEFYGVNKKNKGLSNQPIKSDLSYIDISECIEKIYKSNKMKENDDIVILKFDVNKIPNKFLINPVEYKLINSRTGKELDASICEHNSIKISYPVHDLINRYDRMTRKLRSLEYMKIDLTSNNKDSLREKIDKGKEIVEEYNDTDIFNINDKIFSDICIAVEVDGKDLVLEDRINYFYPQLSLCENNCTYNHTDFPNERIYCDCSYKTEFDFEREYSSSIDLNINQVKNDQNGNSNIAVMKCISNMKYSKSLKKNGGFIYSLIIIVIEFILLLIIAFYGINSLSNKLKNKMNKKEDNYEKEEIDVINSNEKENKRTEENIKTSERALNNPTKKKKDNFGIEFIPQEYLFLFFNQGEKDVVKKVERDNVPFKTKYNTRILLEQIKGVNYDNINPRGPFPLGQNLLVIVDSMDENINDYLGVDSSADEDENRNIVNISKNKKRNKFNQTYTSDKGKKYSHGIGEKGNFKANQKAKLYHKNIEDFSYTDYDPSDENYSVYDIEEDEDEPHEKGFIDNLKLNQRFIKRNYDIAVKNKNKNFIEILFTEIIDKIYIIKILLFTRKFDILSLHLSVYLLCHILLLVLNTLFFDIKTITKIWAKDNYPGLGYYLGYGFLACLVVWIIYTIFLCLLTNNDKIKDILKNIHFNNKYQLKKNKLIEKKYKNLMWKVKFKFIVYTIIEYILLALCFLYLTTFGTVYVGTQSRAFKAYGIALIEILIIKVIYGIALAIMRHISLSKEKKSLYNVVLFMDTYLV